MIALATLMLPGCKTSSDAKIELAHVPGDLRTCFNHVVGDPGKIKTRQQIVDLIAKLRASEVRLSLCGRRLLAFYDTQAAEFRR